MILVAGSANLDFVVRADHIPGPGETVLGREFKTYPGGKGANQAVACARSGAALTHMLVALGADAFAIPLEASLTQANVQLHTVRVQDHPTGTAFICVSDDAENAITVAPGANACLRPEHLPSLDDVTHLLMQLEIPLDTIEGYAQAARKRGVLTVLNAAPAQALSERLLDAIDILVVNEGELQAITLHSGTIAECLALINVPTVVVTLGHQGSCARHHGEFLVQPAFHVTAVDTTAAGDTFCGTLVASLSKGCALQTALQFASAAGALACTRLGAQSSVPSADEVNQFLAVNANQTQATTAQLRQFCGLIPTTQP
jgi:ribokinase